MYKNYEEYLLINGVSGRSNIVPNQGTYLIPRRNQ